MKDRYTGRFYMTVTEFKDGTRISTGFFSLEDAKKDLKEVTPYRTHPDIISHYIEVRDYDTNNHYTLVETIRE
jgi:hypothetical protein